MRVVDAGYEIIKETEVRKRIERGARLCYKSEDFIKEGSDVKIITALGKKQHTAMFEHGNLVVRLPQLLWNILNTESWYIEHSVFPDKNTTEDAIKAVPSKKNFLRFTATPSVSKIQRDIVSGNMRAWIETLTNLADNAAQDNGYYPLYMKLADIVCDIMGTKEVLSHFYDHMDFIINGRSADEDSELIQALCDIEVYTQEDINTLSIIEQYVHNTMSVIFTVDRGVTHELVRMRRASFAQESTRYCNYANDKFDNEITVIKPVWWDKWTEAIRESWERAMIFAEEEYMNMLKDETVKAQQARSVLPHSLKVDIMVTAPMDEWRHIFNLRACDATGPAHPQMKEVMVPLLKEAQTIYPDLFGDMVPAEVI